VTWLRGISFIFLFLLATTLKAGAQIVMDTAMNRIVPDTLPERTAPVLAEPAPDQQAYDSLKSVIVPFQPTPKKSALFSAILPGAGQIYNRQYWKVPIIYAGMAASFYFLIDNSNNYQRYRRAYIARINNPGVQDDFTQQLVSYSSTGALNYLKGRQDTYKQQLDLTYLLTGLGFTIQVLDALAFAHLKNFDVSKNISMRLKPVMLPTGTPGVGLAFNFK
jgi:hypothetical protein